MPRVSADDIRRTALILHGVNVWNTGDRGLLETTVARLRDELGPDVQLWSEDVFSHEGAAFRGHLERLELRSVPAMLPLREHRGWSRPRWLAHLALITFAVLAVRMMGWRVLDLLPNLVAQPLRALRDADVVISKPGGHLYSAADRRIGSPAYLFTIWVVPIEEVGDGRLLAKVQALHRNLAAVRETLARTIPELRTAAAANARLVRELLGAGS